MPGYKFIHQGYICSKHGGLLIYSNDDFTYDKRTLYKHSGVWEGVFIDVSGPSLNRPFTIGNIYRPPHDNNDNENISKFIVKPSPIVDLLHIENKCATVVGDFNVNLLQINERETFSECFDMMFTNSFFPKSRCPLFMVRIPTACLIDQMFNKIPQKRKLNLLVHNHKLNFWSLSVYRTFQNSRRRTKTRKNIYTRMIIDSAINDCRSLKSHLAWMLICYPTQISTTGSS